ncbi:WD40 repeat-like protein [Fomitiporia mediterranea MF3/22]|uniref:WD40 repeat-like protein n=1 Tax=Fomitiporia mediterranea (strain MF3/22) TaxID=694068 RepID=UPI0004407F55|nr:WD40 repeat-like protein [Fomitiporia mediterranea MF3/22]EJD02273.1 WD40 repeat-like protein [Fomitiporia mediterranea MF3/22]
MENDLTFVAPEGVYSNVEDHKPTPYNAHIVYPTTYPTKLSTIVLHYPITKPGVTPGLPHWQLLGGGKDKEAKHKEKERDREKEREDGQSLSSSDRPGTDEEGNNNNNSNNELLHSPTLQPQPLSPSHESPKLFSSPSISMARKKPASRPKHNIRTTTSTFVTRIQSVENLNKIVQNKQGTVTYLFYNSAKNFFWTELGVKAKEPLSRITFSAFPTCHDVNRTTAKMTSLDIVIGFNTGDLIWFDPITGRYMRLNKQGCINNSPCTAVRWVPGSPSVFVASHADGTIIVYDKEREDGTFTPQQPFKRHTAPPVSQSGSSSSSIPSDDASSREEWDPLESIFVTTPKWLPVTSHTGLNRGRSEKERTAKNPVSHWRVSKRAVVDFAYSSDARLVAAISDDGCLRIIDALQESLVDCFASYFGSFTCVAFSDDSRFVLTGGQDDLVTIFSMTEGRVIARCQGHSSFISSVAFDSVRTDKRSYRFGSVGEDNKLILWDFSAGVLHRPKLQAAQQQRMSMSSTLSLALRRRGDAAEGSTLHLPPPAMNGEETSKYHPAPSRNEVAVVQPVLTKHIECDLLTGLAFTQSSVLTASKNGAVKMWVRPLALRPRPTKPRILHSHINPSDIL